MAHAGRERLGRIIRDPYTLLLTAAAAIQVALASSQDAVDRPGWALGAIGAFAVACALAVLERVRGITEVSAAPPFVLLLVAALWRAAVVADTVGIGGLCAVAVLWLGFYGSMRQVWLAVAGTFAVMLAPPLLLGDGISSTDWRRAALAGALAMLIGPTVRSLVQRGMQAALRVTALEPANSRLDAVLRAATGHMIVAWDADGTVVEFNQGAEQLLGIPAEQVIGTRTPLLFADPDLPASEQAESTVGSPVVSLVEQAAKYGDTGVRDWTCPTPTGPVVVSLSITGVRGAAGALIGWVAIGTDVTAARTALRNLAAQQEVYRLLVENLPMTTVGLFDDDLHCLTIGGHWLRRVGADPASFVGRPALDFFDGPDRERAAEIFAQGRSEPVTVQTELANGRCYEFAVLPVDGHDGARLVLILARDVTAQRTAEKQRQDMLSALAVSEANFREAFEGAPIGMALTTADPDTDERFLRVNPAFAAIIGRCPDDLVGVAVADITHPEDLPLQPGGHVGSPGLRKRLLRPTGRAVWVEVSRAVVRDEDGVPSHVITQIQDVEAIKQSERALLDAFEQQRAATARLRELDRIRTELVGTVSHELRTPLTSVHGYLELLGGEPLSETQHAMLDVAMRNTERLSDLVDNLLVLVRLDDVASFDSVGTEDVAVTAVVSGAIDTVRPEVVDRGQHLEVELPPEPAVIRGDAAQLDRVLVNLLSNAAKYTPRAGRIAVSVTTDDDAPRTVRITVADSGIGIPPDEVPHLFGRFFRASTARASAISGNGLGLAIVKSIVERHGGQVGVESTVGVGSRFTVTLPLAAAREASSPFAPDAVGGHR